MRCPRSNAHQQAHLCRPCRSQGTGSTALPSTCHSTSARPTTSTSTPGRKRHRYRSLFRSQFFSCPSLWHLETRESHPRPAHPQPTRTAGSPNPSSLLWHNRNHRRPERRTRWNALRRRTASSSAGGRVAVMGRAAGRSTSLSSMTWARCSRRTRRSKTTTRCARARPTAPLQPPVPAPSPTAPALAPSPAAAPAPPPQ